MKIARRGLYPIAAALIATGVAASAFATDTPCAMLTKEQASRKQALFQKLYAYDGCDRTLSKCLETKNPHFAVQRAADDVCRRIQKGESDNEIAAALEKRAESFLPGIRTATIETDPRMLFGDPTAPVTLAVYACTRCPFCKVLLPPLFQAVTHGSLKGKVSIQFRLFPIKSHPGALEGGLALEAAASLGRFAPFLKIVYDRFDTYKPEKLSLWAEEAGMNRDKFDTAFAAASTRDAVIRAKQEGVVNKVRATPTLFINGVRYVYDLNEAAVIDLLEEATLRAAAEKGDKAFP